MLSDDKLIDQIKYGNERAAEELITRYYASILRYCRWHCSSVEKAEDLTQEIFYKLFKNISGYQGKRKFKAYLYTIANRVCIDESRKIHFCPLEDEESIVDECNEILRLEDKEEVNYLLSTLSPEQREAIILRFGEQLEFHEIVGLSNVANKKVKTFSGGMKQRVGIAQALLNNPGILILDEPTAGLDPKERVRFRNLLSEYAGDKIVILSTHIVSDVEAIADEVLLMKKGKFVLQGAVQELTEKANGKVWELTVSPSEARKWQTRTTVANLRHEGKDMVLRIVSDNMPSKQAVPCEATLEDLYLYYFPTEEGGQ